MMFTADFNDYRNARSAKSSTRLCRALAADSQTDSEMAEIWRSNYQTPSFIMHKASLKEHKVSLKENKVRLKEHEENLKEHPFFKRSLQSVRRRVAKVARREERERESH